MGIVGTRVRVGQGQTVGQHLLGRSQLADADGSPGRLYAAARQNPEFQLLFADRGLHIPGDALKFMNDRLHRDYWTAERAVEAIDRFAIGERARLTLPTIRRALIDAKLIGEAA